MALTESSRSIPPPPLGIMTIRQTPPPVITGSCFSITGAWTGHGRHGRGMTSQRTHRTPPTPSPFTGTAQQLDRPRDTTATTNARPGVMPGVRLPDIPPPLIPSPRTSRRAAGCLPRRLPAGLPGPATIHTRIGIRPEDLSPAGRPSLRAEPPFHPLPRLVTLATMLQQPPDRIPSPPLPTPIDRLPAPTAPFTLACRPPRSAALPTAPPRLTPSPSRGGTVPRARLTPSSFMTSAAFR